MAVIAKQRYKLDIAPKGGWVIVYASQHDNGAREIEFEITNQGNAFSIPASINVSVQGIKSNKSYFSHSCSYSGNIVTMALADDMTDVIGKAICVLKFTNSSQQKLATAKFILNVDSDSSSEGVIIDTEAEEIFNQMLDEIRAQAASVSADIAELQSMVGSPLVASTVSAMTDHNKIYVYTGSESGYTNGNWYYWDGSAWTSGGVYNSTAFETDSTLTKPGQAADAKETGDEISDLKEDLNAVFTTTKNLLDCEFANAVILNGVYSESELPTQTAEEAYIEVESEKDYVFSWSAVSSVYPTLYVTEYASDKSFIKYTSLSTRSYPTVETTATTKYIRLYLFEANTTSWQSLVPTDFQMEEGTTPTAYVAPKQIDNDYIGELPYVKDNQGAQNEGKALIVQNDGSVGLGTISGADASLAVKVSDIVLMASINHSLRLPMDIAGVDVTDATGWVKTDVIMSVVKNLYDPVNRIHRDCVSVKSTSNGIAYFNLGQSVDATKKPLLISIALDQSFNIENDRSVDIVLYSGSGRSSSYRAELYLQYADTGTSFNTAYCMNGFFNLCIFTDSGSYRSKGTYFDPTDVTAVGVHIYHATGTERTVYIADMKFVEPMQKGGIVTIIDNFGTQVPAMADYAYSKGVRLNLSIIPGFYEGSSLAPTCASKSELDRVAQQGHFIWNHTYEHLVFNNLTDKQIADEINLAEKWMYINGYGRGAKFVSVPSAKFNTDSFNSVVKTNANMIFHKWGYMGTWAYAPYYPCTRQLPTTILDSATDHSATNLIVQARKGFDNGGISVVGFHGTYWDNDNGDSWKAYIDGISAIENIYHYGLDEIFNGQWC